jgi:hypothetical protein
MLGECERVRNVRASGEAAIINGRRRRLRLEEVPAERRAPIIKAYLRLAPGGRPHIGLGKSATIADCQRVAPNHPVFQIIPYQDAPGPEPIGKEVGAQVGPPCHGRNGDPLHACAAAIGGAATARGLGARS